MLYILHSLKEAIINCSLSNSYGWQFNFHILQKLRAVNILVAFYFYWNNKVCYWLGLQDIQLSLAHIGETKKKKTMQILYNHGMDGSNETMK